MVNKSEKVVNGAVCELNFIRGEEFCPTGDTFLLEVCKTFHDIPDKKLFAADSILALESNPILCFTADAIMP